MRIAIQGQAGSFHDIAAHQWFQSDIEIISADTFSGVFTLLKAKQAEAALIAIENSLYGSINEVYDLIEAHDYSIVGEVHLRVEHQLIGFEGTKLSDITKVYSQLPALAQCADYIDRVLPQAERIEHHDTAESVAFVKRMGDPTAVAIASRRAAELHGMEIIDENIEDHAENYTRFLVLQPETSPLEAANRSSLVLQTSHEPGALANVLMHFADSGINLSKLQSRPIVGSPWKYRFYLVVDAAGPTLHEAIAHVTEKGASVKVLGEYVSTA